MIHAIRRRENGSAAAMFAAALSALIVLQGVAGPLAARALALETGRLVLCGGGVLYSFDGENGATAVHAAPCAAAHLDASPPSDPAQPVLGDRIRRAATAAQPPADVARTIRYAARGPPAANV